MDRGRMRRRVLIESLLTVITPPPLFPTSGFLDDRIAAALPACRDDTGLDRARGSWGSSLFSGKIEASSGR